MTRPIPADIRAKLARKVSPKFIKTKPQKGSPEYVPHPVVRQFLLLLTDDHREEVIREHSFPSTGQRRDGTEYEYTKVAMLVELSVCIDGVWYGPWQEWGESENENNPYKSAQSDAIKRLVAMHLGIGLHLWARDHYFLDQVLADRLADVEEVVPDDAEGALDDGVPAGEVQREAKSEPPPAGPAPTATGPTGTATVTPLPDSPRGPTKARNIRFHNLLEQMECADDVYRAALAAAYGPEAAEVTEDGEVVSEYSIKYLPRAKANKLVDTLEASPDKQVAFMQAGMNWLATRQTEEGTDG
jgi:hypothetical protein